MIESGTTLGRTGRFTPGHTAAPHSSAVEALLDLRDIRLQLSLPKAITSKVRIIMAKTTPQPKVQNIDKVRNGGIQTIFKKSAELYRKMLHNGYNVRAKQCRFTIVVEYDGKCDVFLSDKSAASTRINLKVDQHCTPIRQIVADPHSPCHVRKSIPQRTLLLRPKQRLIGRCSMRSGNLQLHEATLKLLERVRLRPSNPQMRKTILGSW
jgi:hypothetical protein